ncbi:hypothetical protein HER39_18825, partial [Arthrobacter deserti]|nr:hypothetical protein [Arthrobacter deserti]
VAVVAAGALIKVTARAAGVVATVIAPGPGSALVPARTAAVVAAGAVLEVAARAAGVGTAVIAAAFAPALAFTELTARAVALSPVVPPVITALLARTVAVVAPGALIKVTARTAGVGTPVVPPVVTAGTEGALVPARTVAVLAAGALIEITARTARTVAAVSAPALAFTVFPAFLARTVAILTARTLFKIRTVLAGAIALPAAPRAGTIVPGPVAPGAAAGVVRSPVGTALVVSSTTTMEFSHAGSSFQRAGHPRVAPGPSNAINLGICLSVIARKLLHATEPF